MRLLLCDAVEEWKILEKKTSRLEKQKTVIATSSVEFYRYAQDHMADYAIEFLQYSRVCYNDCTTEILKNINQIICNGCKKKYLFETGYSIEGSGLPQQIIDVLYDAEVCMDLWRKYKFEELYLFCNKKNFLMVEVFREIAKTKQIRVRVYYQPLKTIIDFSNRIFICSNGMVKSFKYAYYCFNTILEFGNILLKSIYGKKYRSQEKQWYDVGRVWFSDAVKHYNWGKAKLEQYKKHFKLNVICSGTKEETLEKFKTNGFYATQFEESHIYFKYTIQQIVYYYRHLIRINSELKKYEYCLKNIDISQIIIYRIKQHLMIEVPRAVCIECRAKGYFEKHKFKYMEGWMGSNNIYTRIFYYNTRDAETIFFRVSHHDASPVEPIIHEEVEPEIIEMRFFCGNSRQQVYHAYKRMGWNGEAILLKASVGKKKNISSKKIDEPICILWAPSYPVKGYLTCGEWERINEDVLNGLLKINCKVIAKYHTNQDDFLIEKTKTEFQHKGIYIAKKEEAIEKYIESADIVLTTPSTVIYDSMFLDKIVIAITEGCSQSLIKEIRFLECANTRDVINCINELLRSKDKYESRLKVQREFVNKFLDFEVEDVNVRIAQILKEKLTYL